MAKDNFDLREFLTENKLTTQTKMLLKEEDGNEDNGGMSEEEVIKSFEEDVLPSVEKKETNGIDKPMRREAFNNYIDALHKDGEISDELVNSIVIPDRLEDPKKDNSVSENEDNYREDMEKLGFDLSAGNRIDAFEKARDEYGIDEYEILRTMSDDQVYKAIDYSLEVSGAYTDIGEDEEEEEEI